MSLYQFRSLPAKERALVATAVLLDGRDAGVFLELDGTYGEALMAACEELAQHPLDLRLPLVGTLLREALRDLDPRRTSGGGTI